MKDCRFLRPSSHNFGNGFAKAFGIPVEYEKDERTDADIAAEKKRESMRAILTLSQNFFSEQFLSDSPEAQAARAYAYSRWDEEYCKQFGICHKKIEIDLAEKSNKTQLDKS